MMPREWKALIVILIVVAIQWIGYNTPSIPITEVHKTPFGTPPPVMINKPILILTLEGFATPVLCMAVLITVLFFTYIFVKQVRVAAKY